jgi:hypothetical protein
MIKIRFLLIAILVINCFVISCRVAKYNKSITQLYIRTAIDSNGSFMAVYSYYNTIDTISQNKLAFYVEFQDSTVSLAQHYTPGIALNNAMAYKPAPPLVRNIDRISNIQIIADTTYNAIYSKGSDITNAVGFTLNGSSNVTVQQAIIRANAILDATNNFVSAYGNEYLPRFYIYPTSKPSSNNYTRIKAIVTLQSGKVLASVSNIVLVAP